MAKRVAIIILNWNGEKLLREFLPSVVKNTNSELGRVVVVDNHSTDGSWACLEQEFPNVERVLFEDNFGFAGGYNRAIEIAADIFDYGFRITFIRFGINIEAMFMFRIT